MKYIFITTFFCFYFLTSTPAVAAVSLSASAASPSPVGIALNWTATFTGAGSDARYRWTVTRPDGATSRLSDYDKPAIFEYMPLQDGAYRLSVTARNIVTLEEGTTSVTYLASSLQTDTAVPVVTPTANSLIALYSATCATGSMRVFFAPEGNNPLRNGMGTQYQPCVSGKSINFIIAGMRPNTTYNIRHRLFGSIPSEGPQVTFTTGSAPALPTATIQGNTTAAEKVALFSFLGIGGIQGMAAYDTTGSVIWYSDKYFRPFLFRPMPGGTLTMRTSDFRHLLEIDLLGNVVGGTNADRILEQLPAGSPYIREIHHDVIRLPNNHTAFLISISKFFTDGTQGGTPANPKELQGDGIVVVDQNWRVVWNWDPFKSFDVTRPPVAPSPCNSGGNCQDWLHANSLLYTADNNLVISLRNQDLLIKVNYANGLGNGDLLWKLGSGGDFTIVNSQGEIWPWFSGQHSPTYKGNYLTLFDNSNSRVEPGVSFDIFNPNLCCSRGQAWIVDEANRQVTLATILIWVNFQTSSAVHKSYRTAIYTSFWGLQTGGSWRNLRK